MEHNPTKLDGERITATVSDENKIMHFNFPQDFTTAQTTYDHATKFKYDDATVQTQPAKDSVNATASEELKIEIFHPHIKPLENHILKGIIETHCEIFNEGWAESWTFESAEKELRGLFYESSGRESLLCVLFKGNTVVGYALGQNTDTDHLSPKLDMPLTLSEGEKLDGIYRTKYIFETVIKQKQILAIQLLAIQKPYRNAYSPRLILPLLQSSLSKKVNTLYYWSNINSGAFKWGVGMGWYPYHFFMKNDLLLMFGSIPTTIYHVERVLVRDRQAFTTVFSNLRKFECRT